MQIKASRGRRPAPLVLSAGAAWLAVSCGTTGPETSVAVRDSAGVEIVVNPAIPATEITIADPPRLAVGVAEGEEALQLSGVVGAVLTSTGQLVVANGDTNELRWFGSSGSFVRSVGGEGEGPGEFMSLGALTVRGDSLLAHDARQGSFTLFGESGDLVRTTPPGALFFRLLGDGRLVSYGVGERSMPAPGRTTRAVGFLLRHDSLSAEPDTVARFLLRETYVDIEIPGFSERMFGRGSAALVHGDGFWIADNETYEIRELDSVGRLKRLIRRAVVARSVTESDVARWVETRKKDWDGPRADILVRPLLNQPPHAAMPAFGRSGLVPGRLPWALFDREGRLWIQEYQAFPDEAPSWSVFDAGGRLVATVALPVGFQLTYAEKGAVVGVWRDGLDVEYVHVYDVPTITEKTADREVTG